MPNDCDMPEVPRWREHLIASTGDERSMICTEVLGARDCFFQDSQVQRLFQMQSSRRSCGHLIASGIALQYTSVCIFSQPGTQDDNITSQMLRGANAETAL
ncbi:hypothetical protein TgHK011_007997 [Trichoderma gracile]|nr:hypothetical protein TgHK011_007997 [Trichoderma gracile]